MQVLLIQDVAGLGHAGDIKKVADGYALNYLIARGLAMVATEGAVRQAKQVKEASERHRQHKHSEAEILAQKLSGLVVRFKAKVGEGDKLYGSITNADIAEAVGQKIGESIDKRRVEMEHPIRDLGPHQVPLRVGPEVVAEVTVVVQREDEA